MTDDGYIYNYKGDKYWLAFVNELGKLNLYEGRHGRYIGVIVKNVNDYQLVEEKDIYCSFDEFKRDFEKSGDEVSIEIFDYKRGTYLGEIKEGRLVVDNFKKKKHMMKKNTFYQPFGRNGCSKPKDTSLKIPKGYYDFEVGWE